MFYNKLINQLTQLRMEYCKYAIPFLDLLPRRNNAIILMNTYYKSPNTYSHLLFLFNHSSHFKKNIPFTLAHHIYTFTENTDAKKKHLENLKMNLSRFKNPKQLIDCGIQRALNIPLQELSTPNTVSNNNSHNNF